MKYIDLTKANDNRFKSQAHKHAEAGLNIVKDAYKTLQKNMVKEEREACEASMQCLYIVFDKLSLNDEWLINWIGGK